MAQHDGDGNGRDGWVTQIRDSKEQAYHARRALRRELPAPSMEAKRAVAEAAADFYDILEDYHDEQAVSGEFDERVPVKPHTLLSRTVEMEQPADSSANPHATRSVEVPAVATADAESLLRLSKELDAIAKELGFAAAADERTPVAADTPQLLPDHILEHAPAFQEQPEARTDGGDEP